MATVQIIGISKDGGNHQNPNEGITHYKWINNVGKSDISTREEMVKWIEDGNHAYVENAEGKKAYCGVRSLKHKFLQTYSDDLYNDNLLSLPPF